HHRWRSPHSGSSSSIASRLSSERTAMSEFPAPPPPPQPGGPRSGDGPSGPRAGFGQRFGAALIDGILIGVVGLVLKVAIGQTGGGLIGVALGVAYFGYLEGSNS